MLNTAIIGVGNAGGQVADLANMLHDIPGIALNSSEQDARSIHSIDPVIIGDEKGAGKDRGIAKSFIRKEIKTLLSQPVLTELLDNRDVVYIISSTGGGTGSGIAPVLKDILARVYPATQFILVGILPPLKESIAAQHNSIEFLKELYRQEGTYMLYDNNNYNHLSTTKMMEHVNTEIVQDIRFIRGDYQIETPYNSIDEKDMSKILETTGRLVVSRIHNTKEKDIDIQSIEERLVNDLKNNAHAELDRDKIIKRRGLIVNLNEKLYATLDTNLDHVNAFVGEPVEGFEHIYVNADATPLVGVVMSGLSIPDDRIEKINQRVEEATAALSRKKESSLLETSSTDVIGDLRRVNKPTSDAKNVNIDDIFEDY